MAGNKSTSRRVSFQDEPELASKWLFFCQRLQDQKWKHWQDESHKTPCVTQLNQRVLWRFQLQLHYHPLSKEQKRKRLQLWKQSLYFSFTTIIQWQKNTACLQTWLIWLRSSASNQRHDTAFQILSGKGCFPFLGKRNRHCRRNRSCMCWQWKCHSWWGAPVRALQDLQCFYYFLLSFYKTPQW